MAEGVEAGVLSEDGGVDTADQKVFVGGIGESVPVVAAVTDGAVSELGVGVAVEGEASLDARDQERRVVEAIAGCQMDLLFWRHGWKFGVCGDGTEVGHDAKDSLGLLGTLGNSAVWRRRCLWSGGCRLTGLRCGLSYRSGRVWKSGVKAGRAGGNELLCRERKIKTDSQRYSGDTCQGGSQIVSKFKGHKV